MNSKIIGSPVLPAEMFELVIAQMNVNQRISCRAVCKFFKQAVDKIKIRNLAIAESEDSVCDSVFGIYDYEVFSSKPYRRFSDQFHFVSNDPVHESDTLIAPNTTGLRMLVNHLDLSQLRRLFTVEVRTGRDHFELLNRLVQLEHLEINWIELDGNLRLQLPHLRTLSIVKLIGDEEFHIWLATPNLKHFETKVLELSRFQFEHPDSVIFLQVRGLAHDDVLKLRSLEVLVCEQADDLVWIDYSKGIDDENRVVSLDLSAFKKLRRVDCACINGDQFYELNDLCQTNEIEFYYCGQRIDNQNRVIGEYVERAGRTSRLDPLTIDSLFKEYDRLADSLYCIDGNRYWKYLEVFFKFVSYFPDKLPKDFAKRFYSVREVYVFHKIENVNYFAEFLSCFKNLKVLWLDVAMPQEFFDRHSHLFARLQEFEYTHLSMTRTLLHKDKVNLNFILTFKLLETFRTDQAVSMHLVSDAINNLKHLKSFCVSRDFDDKKCPAFAIHRTEDGYRLVDFPRPESKFKSKDELLKFIKKRFPALSKRG